MARGGTDYIRMLSGGLTGQPILKAERVGSSPGTDVCLLPQDHNRPSTLPAKCRLLYNIPDCPGNA